MTVRYSTIEGEVCFITMPEGVIPPPGVLMVRDNHTKAFFNYEQRGARTDLLTSLGGEQNTVSKAVRRYLESWHFPKEAE